MDRDGETGRQRLKYHRQTERETERNKYIYIDRQMQKNIQTDRKTSQQIGWLGIISP